MTLASCDSRKTAGENPFFTEWDTPHGVPPFDKILPEHFMPAFERGMSLHEAEIDAITSNKDEATFENTILAYDNAGQMLAQTELVFGMLCAAETNDRMQALQEQAMPLLAAHRDKIRLDDKLFVRVKEVYDRRAALGLDAEQMRLLQKTYDSFVRAGALLDAEQKARLKEINGQLSLTAVKFGNNILAENNNFVLELKSDELDGLPAGIRDAAREKAQQMGKGDKWVFTLHKPSLIPLLTYSTRRDLREKIYKAYLNRCNNGDEYDNKQLINDFIRLRTEKAHLLGYPSYAAYVVADEMAGTTDAVYGLLDQIWTPALERAKGELAEMDTLLQKDIPGATFESWDWWYYAEKLRKQNYALDEEMLRPYFSLENVQGGRGIVPQVLQPVPLRRALEHAAREGELLFFYEEGTESLRETLKNTGDRLFLFVGPEGGFSREEAELAASFGAKLLTLGPRILRTETAPVAALAAIFYEKGDMEISR